MLLLGASSRWSIEIWILCGNFLIPGSRSLTFLKHDDYVTRNFGFLKVWERAHKTLQKKDDFDMFTKFYHIALLPRRAGSC